MENVTGSPVRTLYITDRYRIVDAGDRLHFEQRGQDALGATRWNEVGIPGRDGGVSIPFLFLHGMVVRLFEERDAKSAMTEAELIRSIAGPDKPDSDNWQEVLDAELGKAPASAPNTDHFGREERPLNKKLAMGVR